jgi:hypothetical protein
MIWQDATLNKKGSALGKFECVALRPWRNDNGQAKNAGLGCDAPGHHG